MRTRHLWLLRWATIMLPLVFIATVLYVGQFVFPQLVRTLAGFLVLMAAVATAVFLFSYFVFALIERTERGALSRHQELLVLNTLAASASQPMKLEELLQLAVDGVVETVGVDGGIACILDEKNQELLHVAYRNIPEDMLGPLRRVKLEEGRIHTEVVRTGEPVYVKDLSQDPRFQVPGRKPHFSSVLTLPLKSEGKVKGVLALVSRSPHSFEPAQVQFLLTLGGQLAVAIDRTQLQQQVASLAVLEERERIAREMHDGMAQTLGYINTQTISVKKLLSNGQLVEAREELTRMEEIARDLYADVREGILGLRAAAQRQKGFIPTLREYTERYIEAFFVPVEITVSPEAERFRLPPNAEIQLLRVFQEALTNVRKHARATAVAVAFECNGRDELRVTIADNGRGFELMRLPSTGWPRFGIQTMRERVEAVGGTLQIDTAPGQGTRVQVRIPVAQRET